MQPSERTAETDERVYRALRKAGQSVRDLVASTGLSHAGVRRALQRLEAAGRAAIVGSRSARTGGNVPLASGPPAELWGKV